MIAISEGIVNDILVKFTKLDDFNILNVNLVNENLRATKDKQQFSIK